MTEHPASRNIYALLVGIDDYIGRVPPLKGCVNDIRGIDTYLRDRIDSQRYQLHIKTLLNQEATRQAIIDGFQQHLLQADRNDIVLFYYSGHGSQEAAPEEFWPIEPDRLNETLVCWDSREVGGRDLADKELSYLIHQVAQSNPQIVLIMDCCHSGSGTREVTPAGVRHAPADHRQRNLRDFIFADNAAYLEQLLVQDSSTRSTDLQSPEIKSGWTLPIGQHILLAGCHDSELASEYAGDGEQRGAFSYFLLDTLQKTNGSLTYRELYKRASSLVRGRIKDQSPQLEATNPKDLDRPFLADEGVEAIAARPPYYTLSCDAQGQWGIDGGAVHGLPQGLNEPLTLALYPQGASANDMRQPSSAVGEVLVTQVFPSYSQVQFTTEPEGLSPETVWNAVVTRLPISPLEIYVEGDEAAISRLRFAVALSTYLHEVRNATTANIRVLAKDEMWRITQPMDDRALIDPVAGYGEETVAAVIQRLEHIARWTTMLELTSPMSGSLPPNAVEMHLYQGETEITDSVVRLEYGENGQRPTFQLKLKNQTDQRLYCTLLNMTEEYSVSAPFFGAGGKWLEPQEEVAATAVLGGKLTDQIPTNIPTSLWNAGVTEYQDVLKLIVSTAEFDAQLLEQNKLDKPAPDSTRALGIPAPGTLNRLMKQVTTRGIAEEDELEIIDEWVTSQIAIVTVRPQKGVSVSHEVSQSLGNGVQLREHANLKAKARLISVSQASRDVSQPPLPALIRDHCQPFQFTASRGVDLGLSALELMEVENPESVSPADPLTLEVSMPLAEDELLLPLAYDGEFYVPLGRGLHREGQTQIELQQLPQPVVNRRSITGSIQIYFQKVIRKTLGKTLSDRLGLTFDYPILAIAETQQGEVSYIPEVEAVQGRVSQAEKIVVFIHGIFGDTESIVPCINTPTVEMEGQKKTIAEIYDLVLTFDYENINTSIKDNAAKLKQRLQSVGLGPGHGKTVHLVAHSMGGLVSRHFIEALGGNEMVQHLTMLGTPNAGSPWPEVQRGATAAVAFMINGLSLAFFPLKLVGGLLEKIEAIDVSLDEMEPGSDFLEGLVANGDPQIPYSVVVGNTSLIPDDKAANLRERLRKKLAKGVEIPFMGKPNDIAVSVDSIKGVPGERVPQPIFEEVACNHLVYFTDPAGIAGLGKAIARALDSNPVRNHDSDIQPETEFSDDLEASAPVIQVEQVEPETAHRGLPEKDVEADPPENSLEQNTEPSEMPAPSDSEVAEATDQGENIWPKVAIAIIIFAGLILGFIAIQKANQKRPAVNEPQSYIEMDDIALRVSVRTFF